MNTAIVETKQVGGSIMVAIPRSIKKSMGIEKGQTVEITVKKVKPSCFGKFKDIPRFTQEDELQIE